MTGESRTLDAILMLRPGRAQTYGDARKGFTTVAALWNAYLAGRPGGAAAPISDIDVPVLVALLKTARISTGVAHHDNFADAANYMVLAGDLAFPADDKSSRAK
ncbi:MAG: DUF6378 domain-containing protein [Alphaproteobacteria bacterium]|nr:DUF6378 domain-containing protein [Alphaproteobacteria bacterium]